MQFNQLIISARNTTKGYVHEGTHKHNVNGGQAVKGSLAPVRAQSDV